MKMIKKLTATAMALAIASTPTAVTAFAGSTDISIPAVNVVAEGEEETPSILTKTMDTLEMTINLEKNEVKIKDTETGISMEFKENGVYVDGTIIETLGNEDEDEDESEPDYEATQEDFEFILTMMAVLAELQTDTLIFTDNVVEVKCNIIENETTPTEYHVQFGKNIKSITPDLIIAPDSTITIYGYKGTVAETYAAENNYPFIALDNTSATDDLGDINDDNKVDSSDASLILEEYANIQTGAALVFNDTQKKSADVNKDSKIDSADASKILEYYGAISTGQTPSWD